MKFKEIKPGMVIHCPKEEDARALLAHLKELRYNIRDTHPRLEWEKEIGEGIFYEIQSDDFWCWGRKRMEYFQAGRKITEFSDLIEPDDSPVNSDTDSPMSAVEVLEWLRNHYNDYSGEFFARVFGADYTLSELLIEKKLSPREIVDSITAYEATKKEKPVEVEEGWRIEVYEENGDLWNKDSFWFGYTKEEVESIAKRVAIDCVRQTGKLATWSVIDACKVKENE